MTRSDVQLKIEIWIRQTWLPKVYGQAFQPEPLRLISGGNFNFDAVSEDDTIIVNISTSSAKTARGKHAAGTIQKIRADVLFLMMTLAEKRLIVLTEKDMFDYWEAEKVSGRVPLEIEFVHAPLPDDLADQLKEAKQVASQEVSPHNLRTTK
jgi:hypothetical protein